MAVSYHLRSLPLPAPTLRTDTTIRKLGGMFMDRLGYALWHKNSVSAPASSRIAIVTRLARSVVCAALSAVTFVTPLNASTYAEQTTKCPVGGEKFKYMALMSISQWGALPDGMPLGSGRFPTRPPQCPTNGLVMYRDFTSPEILTLTAYVAGPQYKALRNAGETPYYLAYQTAKALGDPNPYWLLLAATWEAKNDDPTSARTRRYNEEFVEAVHTLPIDGTSFDSIALQFRAANALRELGRFPDAEAARAAIVIAPNAGGAEQGAAENRAGWSKLIEALRAPILRRDQSRAPIDMLGEQEVIFRCLAAEAAQKLKQPAPPPLSAFETEYCARPELSAQLAEQRERLKGVNQ